MNPLSYAELYHVANEFVKGNLLPELTSLVVEPLFFTASWYRELQQCVQRGDSLFLYETVERAQTQVLEKDVVLALKIIFKGIDVKKLRALIFTGQILFKNSVTDLLLSATPIHKWYNLYIKNNNVEINNVDRREFIDKTKVLVTDLEDDGKVKIPILKDYLNYLTRTRQAQRILWDMDVFPTIRNKLIEFKVKVAAFSSELDDDVKQFVEYIMM
jgi:hypothetical protein